MKSAACRSKRARRDSVKYGAQVNVISYLSDISQLRLNKPKTPMEGHVSFDFLHGACVRGGWGFTLHRVARCISQLDKVLFGICGGETRRGLMTFCVRRCHLFILFSV